MSLYYVQVYSVRGRLNVIPVFFVTEQSTPILEVTEKHIIQDFHPHQTLNQQPNENLSLMTV